MAIMSLRAYARHRGCNLNAVQDAIKAGRITKTAEGKIDSELADNQWAQNTNPKYQPQKMVDALPEIPLSKPPVDKVDKAVSEPKPKKTAPLPTEPPVTQGRPADGFGSPLVQARTNREHFDALRAELRYRAEKGEYAPVIEINQFVAGMILKARDILLRIGPELRDRLAQEPDPFRCQQMIEKEIHRALNALAEYKPKNAAA